MVKVYALFVAQHLPPLGGASFSYYNMIEREKLLTDLHQAYLDARRHKRNKPYQRLFEANLEANLKELCEDLMLHQYHPGRSTCFLIRDPKRREVFVAQFRDRIVHHLYYNYTHQLLERTFIHDSYSCIKHRGTHFGINRLERHIRQESQNWQYPCYVLKMDIRGYFMHINREKLLEITIWQLRRMVHRWEGVDLSFIEYLTREIVMLNPVSDCIICGNKVEWKELPKEKSLFYSSEGCGLPIGNLTSQLFSNVYLNELDQFMKRKLHCRHYGRYVDDFYVVSGDRAWLQSLIPRVRTFLREELSLTLHDGKTQIRDVRLGVEFLGAYLKPYRRYVSNTSVSRMQKKLPSIESSQDPLLIRSRLNSFLGIMGHYRSWHMMLKQIALLPNTTKWGNYVIKNKNIVFRLKKEFE